MSMARPKGSGLSPQATRWMDPWLLLPSAALVLIGLVMVGSASLHLELRTGSAFHYVNRHLFALVLGGLALFVATQVPIRWWERSGTTLFFLGVLLLALVLVPGMGRSANGATRWLAAGPLSFQPSELMKLFLVVYLAGYLVRRQAEVAESVWGFVKPMVLLVLAALLLMLEPDFGTTAVLMAVALGMLFLAGAPLWQFIVLLSLAGIALSSLILLNPERIQRVTSFVNPWADPTGAGYQLSQALIAFGRGEWFGVGLGNGIQKQFYLPEAHTDFLMAVIGEEFGLVGTVAVISLFAIIIWRAFHLGACAEAAGRRFAGYLCYGLGLWLGLQAVINIGVNVGALPTKGLTLPFMSYGSNSLLVTLLALGLLLRVHIECRDPAAAEEDGWAPV